MIDFDVVTGPNPSEKPEKTADAGARADQARPRTNRAENAASHRPEHVERQLPREPAKI